MGELYEADDLELKERIALKTIRPDIAGIDRINSNYQHHARAATELARTAFDSGTILRRLLDEASA